MEFYENGLFHIYNQGNNGRQVFFSDENYEFFVWKMRSYLLPYGDLIAWCLMPNHFHWLFQVKENVIARKDLLAYRDKIEFARRVQFYGEKAKEVESYTRKNNAAEFVEFRNSIGYLLNAYTKAINKEHGWTGSLFRKGTKAKDGWIDEFIALTKLNGKPNYKFGPGNDYAYTCMRYIHENPVKARLVEKAEDWPYSSASDYAQLRNGTLCNLAKGHQLINFM